MKYLLVLIYFVPSLLFAYDDLVSQESAIKSIPKGWGYTSLSGDFDHDGNDDVVINAYDDDQKKQLLIVLFQKDNGLYKEVLRSDTALMPPKEGGYEVHSIMLDVKKDKLLVVVNSSGASVSEIFTFKFERESFWLDKYEITKGVRCNNYTPGYYGWANKFANKMRLNDFTVSNFYHYNKKSLNITRDVDVLLEEVYQNALVDYKKHDLKKLNNLVSKELIAADDNDEKKCNPDDYMSRYFFADDQSKVTFSNDIAFFLLKSGYYEEAIWLLKRIVQQFPGHTVAYLNLGDAYWGNHMQEEARKVYRTYAAQMKEQGKMNRIPKVVLQRLTQ